ncbi:hypothetical protein SPAN111604_15095 [Sphingomonas antarctica]
MRIACDPYAAQASYRRVGYTKASEPMMNCFQIAAIRIEDERSVITLMILWTWARWTVVATAGRHCGLVKRIDCVSIWRFQRYVDVSAYRLAPTEPEIRFITGAKSNVLRHIFSPAI